MKRIIEIAVMSALMVTIVSCGTTKKAALQAAQQSMDTGEQKVEIPLNGPQYRTDSEYFRETASAVSKDMAIAKQVAVHEARQAMANTVQSTVQSVIKSYLDQISTSADMSGDTYRHFQSMGVTISNLSLSGTELVGEELFRLTDGSYRYHVCLQLSKDSLAKQAAKTAEEAAKEAADKSIEEHKFNEKEFEELFVGAIKMVK